MEELKILVKETIENYPSLKDEVLELFQLCLDEINEGLSMENETYLCIADIQNLIENL